LNQRGGELLVSEKNWEFSDKFEEEGRKRHAEKEGNSCPSLKKTFTDPEEECDY